MSSRSTSLPCLAPITSGNRDSEGDARPRTGAACRGRCRPGCLVPGYANHPGAAIALAHDGNCMMPPDRTALTRMGKLVTADVGRTWETPQHLLHVGVQRERVATHLACEFLKVVVQPRKALGTGFGNRRIQCH